MIAWRDIELFSQFLNPVTMPKESRNRRNSIDRPSPLPSRTSDRRRHRPSPSRNNSPGSPRPTGSAWDEIRCPVCMDHPHSAVLLHCSSHKMGCRPFICNTGCRHSNCLDQYRKAFGAKKLICPLCRGSISGWKVIEAARKGMNAKSWNCSAESCCFTGDYREMKRHARKDHPLVRPWDADAERQREWRRMEQEWDPEDLYSSLQSFLGEEEDEEIEDFGSWLPLLMSSDLI